MPRIPYSKRADGRYYKQICIGYDEAGKKKVKTLYDRDWRELDKKVREFQINLEQGKYIEKDITLGECIDLWWQTKYNLRNSSMNYYKSLLKRVQCLYHLKIKSIKPMQIQNVYTQMQKEGVKRSICLLNFLLKKIFEFAEKNNFVTYNVINRIDIEKEKGNLRRALSSVEKEAVLKAFNEFDSFESLFVMLLLYTGMRRNEILALKWEDINLEENFIEVKKTVISNGEYKAVIQNTTKSEAGKRKIPLMKQLREYILENKYEESEKNEYIFQSKNKTFISSGNFAYRWKKILEKINRNMPNGQTTSITPHYFRHNFATDLVYAGIPLKTAQYIMGHENIEMMMDIYADIREDSSDTINKMDKYLSNMSISS